MKRSVVYLAAIAAACAISSAPAFSQNLNTVDKGTEIRLKLQNDLSTKTAQAGERFTATVVQPVYVDNVLVIPAGTTVNGMVGAVVGTRHFALFHGQAAMSLSLRNIQADGRDIPVQMSIVRVEKPFDRYDGRKRGDVKIDEGQVIEAKEDLKGNLLAGVGITTAGGVIGAIITHVGPGFAIGAIGGGAYVLTRRGKDVQLPKDTGLLVRLDSPLMLPRVGVSTSTATATPNDKDAGSMN